MQRSHDPGGRARTLVAVAAALLAAAACASDPAPGPWGEGRVRRGGEERTVTGGRTLEEIGAEQEAGSGFGEISVPEPSADETRVRIGAAATRDFDAFLSRDRVVMGAVTEVEMSRTPFLALTAFAYDTTAVQRTEARDERTGVLTITLENVSGVRTVYNALPKIELGKTVFIGLDRLVLRYLTRESAARPIHLRAVASGDAVVRTSDPPSRQRGQRVTLDADVVGNGDEARFVERATVDP